MNEEKAEEKRKRNKAGEENRLGNRRDEAHRTAGRRYAPEVNFSASAAGGEVGRGGEGPIPPALWLLASGR